MKDIQRQLREQAAALMEEEQGSRSGAGGSRGALGKPQRGLREGGSGKYDEWGKSSGGGGGGRAVGRGGGGGGGGVARGPAPPPPAFHSELEFPDLFTGVVVVGFEAL